MIGFMFLGMAKRSNSTLLMSACMTKSCSFWVSGLFSSCWLRFTVLA